MTPEEKVKQLEQELRDMRHELALLMNKHYRKPWCCKFASSTNGWNHDSHCKNFVVCY